MDYVSNNQLGAMAYFAGEYAPLYWMECNGRSLSVNEYPAVFAVFKGRYGGDNNRFQVPTVAPLIANGENLLAIFLTEGVFPENIPDELCFITPEPSYDPTYMGLVIPFDGNTPPANWMWCDGRILKMQEAMALYSILGIRFGGQYNENFALPNIPGHIICVTGEFPSHQ